MLLHEDLWRQARVRSGYDFDPVFADVAREIAGADLAICHLETPLGRPDGPWVVIDGYHAFMAIEAPFSEAAASSAFYVGGGYKYAMSGEGCAFLHAPPGFGDRPRITGWFAEFEDLTE